MIISLALTLLVTVSGMLATYLYDESASFAARLCAGACMGLAALGLIGFVFASFLGLTPIVIALTAVAVLIVPVIALRDPVRRGVIWHDLKRTSQTSQGALLRPSRESLGYFIFYVVVSAILLLGGSCCRNSERDSETENKSCFHG